MGELGKRIEGTPQRPALCWIPPGVFLMGSADDDELAYRGERPQHEVVISRPLWVAATPITQAQFAAVWDERHRNVREGPDHPVENVVRHTATKWCDALSRAEGLELGYERGSPMPDAGGYRLPTEAEWEYFCRAGTTTRWWFGDDPDRLTEVAWVGESLQGGGHHPVAQLPANPWGLYDLYGNVEEWCCDEVRVFADRRATDPHGGPALNDVAQRGGHFGSAPRMARSSYRGQGPPEWPNRTRGFRVVRSALA
jgi:formylglycine-generating enzyme required for sulfatase activity